MWEVSLTHPMLGCCCFLICEICFTHTVAGFIFMREFLLHILYWLYFLSGEFLLHIPCWLHFSVGSFLHVPCWLVFFFIWGVSLTHPVLASFLCREFVLHIPCWLHFYAGSFSYTSHAVLQKWLKIILGEFLSHIPCWLLLCREFFTSYAGCIMWDVSLTCPMLAV